MTTSSELFEIIKKEIEYMQSINIPWSEIRDHILQTFAIDLI